jgi:hypothetical protein
MPAILDQHHGSLRQHLRRWLQNRLQALDHEVSPRIAQPKQDHADASSSASRNDLTEVEIECQHDALLPDRLLEDFAVREFLQPFVMKMDCFMARCATIPRLASIRPCLPKSASAISINRFGLPRA